MTELAYSYKVDPHKPDALDARRLRELRLKRLNATLAHARANRRFYRGHLGACVFGPLASLEELSDLPLLDAAVFDEGMEALLCVSPAEVSRIVTLPTSGTTGIPKRLAFTAADQQATREYFAAGIRMLVEAGERVAILFPCERPGGLGELLLQACEQAGSPPVAVGIPTSFTSLFATFQREGPRGVVGFPQHIFAFARWCEYHGKSLDLSGVLLSADNVAKVLQREVARIGGCEVFEHFGMTESGYGCAVDCPAHQGLHVRESDLIVEVVDPLTKKVCKPGEWGELVITTLGRQALPLIRYRTGDYSRILPGLCPCGSPLRRIDAVRPRATEWLSLGDGAKAASLAMADLEELLFALPGLLDFKAGYDRQAQRLNLSLQLLRGMASEGAHALQELKERQPALLAAVEVETTIEYVDEFSPYYPAKRAIVTEDALSER
jgi:phenylacetate-coenzyme A ligase PaaK-like adenylate-forming protein